MEDRSARGSAIQLGNLSLICRTGGVHETRGVDAHFGAPAIHPGLFMNLRVEGKVGG